MNHIYLLTVVFNANKQPLEVGTYKTTVKNGRWIFESHGFKQIQKEESKPYGYDDYCFLKTVDGKDYLVRGVNTIHDENSGKRVAQELNVPYVGLLSI